MAQYKHNFYGTSYYGETNAYSGIYETKEIETEETLKGTANYKIKVKLPTATYRYNDPELLYDSLVWDPVYYDIANGRCLTSTTAGAEISFQGTCDKATMHFVRSAGAATDVKIDVTTILADGTTTVSNYAIDTSTTLADHMDKFEVTGLQYGTQHVKVYLPSTHIAGETLIFSGLEIDATHVTIESRAGYNDSSWTSYVNVPYTKTLISGDEYYLEGTTPSYTDKNEIQLRLHLASSDNELSPVVGEIILTAGDTNNRTPDGLWEAWIDMAALASSLGTTFTKLTTFDWDIVEPNGTFVKFRSQSSSDNTYWTDETVEYVKNTRRLRLKEGINYGWIETPLIDPASHNRFTRNIGWQTWSDQSYLPPILSSVYVKYTFIDARGEEKLVVNAPMYSKSHDLGSTRIPLRVRIELSRRYDRPSPVVDRIDLESRLLYLEDKTINTTNISSVDNFGSGEKVVYDMNNLVYDIPPELTKNELHYRLHDRTSPPSGISKRDVFVYFDSEKTVSNRRNYTTNPADKIWAIAKGRELENEDGIIEHYQYGGGLTYFGDNRNSTMSGAFSPSVNESKLYRYYVKPGWPTKYHIVKKNETLEMIADMYDTTIDEILALSQNIDIIAKEKDGDIYTDVLAENQNIEIPNKSDNSSTVVYWDSEKDLLPESRTQITEKSAQNIKIKKAAGTLDSTTAEVNDNVIGEVTEVAGIGYVSWVSDEKIYSGALNLNNILEDYQRTYDIPDSGSDEYKHHIVETGETYQTIADKYGIDETDLRWENNAKNNVATDSPEVGSVLTVPPRALPPTIPPEAIVGAEPFNAEIIYNSVKMNGQTLSEDIINRISIDVQWKEVSVERHEMTRGDEPGGADLLGHSNIVRIDGVFDDDDRRFSAVSYSSDNYLLEGSYIVWSPGTETDSLEEPATGATYYVSYTHKVPTSIMIKIGSDYRVQSGSDHLWRSKEIKEFEGVCTPQKDYIQELPKITDWEDAGIDGSVVDYDYVLEDNDLWVKTWIEERNGKSYVIGSLQGKAPKENWLPYIHTGYYYLGKDEYYLFSEEKEVQMTENEVPVAKNVNYGLGKFDNAVKLEKNSRNFVRNSGFQVASNKSTIKKVTF